MTFPDQGHRLSAMGWLRRGARFLAVLPVGALLACASLNGAQDAIKTSDRGQTVCPSDSDLTTFEGMSGGERGQHRDDVLSDCISAIDRKYRDFKVDLQQQEVAFNLVTDLASLGLSAGASVASGGTAKSLAAASTGVIGTGTAINKDIFYQQTLPAIEAAMDAHRDDVHTRIVAAENSDPNGDRYTLASARSDIAAYQEAGNIYIAIGELTTTANAIAKTAKDNLQNAKIQYTAQVLEDSVAARETKLADDIRALEKTKNKDQLRDIAKALGVTPNDDLSKERKAILTAIDQAVSEQKVSDPKQAMDKISTQLAPITGKTY